MELKQLVDKGFEAYRCSAFFELLLKRELQAEIKRLELINSKQNLFVDNSKRKAVIEFIEELLK